MIDGYGQPREKGCPTVTVPVLVISGPVGVGKTTVAHEVSEQLEAARIAHTVIDLDALTMTFPRPDDDPFGERLAVANLASVWRNAAQCGAQNLVVARVVESSQQLKNIREAVPGAQITTVCLTASDEDLVARVGRREIGSGRLWHAKRSRDLARSSIPEHADLVLDTTGRTVVEVATDLLPTVAWVR